MYVELQGALLAAPLEWEALLRLVRRQPLTILPMIGWALRGRETLRRRVAARTPLDGSTFPYRPEVIAFLEEQRAAGRRLVLAADGDRSIAEAAADHLGLFDHVLPGERRRGAKRGPTLAAIQADTREKPFDYVGDGETDPEILAAATEVTLVGSEPPPDREPTDVVVERVLCPPGRPGRAVVAALRPHQWSKNLLLAVPAVLGQVWADGGVVLLVVLAMIAFSLTASGIYVLNDLLDLDADRRSPTKRTRPFASGRLPVTWGMALAPLLTAAGLGLAFGAVGSAFGLIVVIYVVATSAYSLALKHRMLIDVIVLAGLYTIRLLAGGAAAGVEVSSWLLAFSMFFFLSLAFAKRYHELMLTDEPDEGRTRSRPYLPVDAAAFQVVGPTCGLLSILVLALYINSDVVSGLYGEPRWLWFLCPVLLYWIVRVWFLTLRGRLHEDPVVFALKDRASYAVAAAALLLLLFAAR